MVPTCPQNGSNIIPQRLQNGSLEASEQPLASLGAPGGPKSDFRAILDPGQKSIKIQSKIDLKSEQAKKANMLKNY